MSNWVVEDLQLLPPAAFDRGDGTSWVGMRGTGTATNGSERFRFSVAVQEALIPSKVVKDRGPALAQVTTVVNERLSRGIFPAEGTDIQIVLPNDLP